MAENTDTLEILKQLAQQVRNATAEGENTAERVGRTLVGIIDHLGDGDSITEGMLDEKLEDYPTKQEVTIAMSRYVTTDFFARLFAPEGEDGAEVDVNDMEAVITAVRVKFGLHTDSYISAKGNNPESGSTVAGASALADLSDVDISNPQDGQILSWNGTKWVNADAPSAGLDEAALAEYLTTNHYAKTTDIPSLEGYATQTWASGQFALKTVAINAGTGLTGGGNLSASRTLSLATVGTAGTYTKVTVDAYGRVTGHASLAAGDIPALAISKITGLQAALDAKMDAADFEELFEKVYVSGYGYAIRAKLALYTDSWMSAKGSNPDAGSVVTGGIDEEELAEYLTTHGYATQSWVNQQGFLKSVAWGDVTGKPAPLANDQYYYGHGKLTTDFNDAVKGGAYFTASEAWPSNGPGTSYRYGALAVFHTGTDNMRVAQLWMSHHSASDGGVYVRMKYEQADGNWQPWARLLDNNCIGSYALTPGNYTDYTVTKTGGGASGTWGIAVTGNAGSATRLQTARTLWGQSFNGTANVTGNLSSVGNISLLSNYAYDCGSNGQQWNNVYSRAYYIGQSRGTNYISEGNGDNASYSTYNLKIHAHWGIGIVDTTDTCRIFMDSRTGSLSAQGTIHADGGIELPYSSGTWLSMATRTALLYGADAQSSGGAHALFRVMANNGGVLAFGGLGNEIGFFGFSKSNIDNGTNDYSFRAAFNMSNYEFATNQGIRVGTYVQVGSARLYYDSSNNALYVQKSDGTQCGFYATGFVSAKGANADAGSAAAGVTELSELDDVAISSPVNGQALVYRNGVWKNETVSGGGSSSVAWADVMGKPSWIPDTDGSGSGIDADLLDGTHKSGLFTAMTYQGSTLSLTIGGVRKSVNIETSAVIPTVSVSSTSSRNLSVNVGGSTDYVNDLYATYLDGTTKQGLFTGMTYSGNKLSVTVGGTTRSVTINAGSSIDESLFFRRRSAYPSDFNNATTMGSYLLAGRVTNMPSGAYEYGALLVFDVYSASYLVQIYIEDGTSKMWVRTRYGGTWKGWRSI